MEAKEMLSVKNFKFINGTDVNFDFFTIDTKNIKGNTFFVPLNGRTDGHDYIIDGVKNGIKGFFVEKGYDDIIKEAIKINKDVVIIRTPNNLRALQNLASLVRSKIDVPVIALTGSFGKTSQREMIYSVLKEKFKVLVTNGNYNNHIGMPLTLINYNGEDVVLLELGSNHMGEIAFLRNICRPTITLITNIGTAHIGNFGKIKNTFKEKLSITKGCEYFLRNNDDCFLKRAKCDGKIIDYGTDCDEITNIIKNRKLRYTICINGKRYKVTINNNVDYLINYSLCAIKVGLILNMDVKTIVKGIDNFSGVAGRMEKKKNGNFFIIDDCYNASYETMISGLNYFNKQKCKNKIVVLGDILELGKQSKKIHMDIAKYIYRENFDFKEIYLVGKEMFRVYKYLIKRKVNVSYFKSVDDVDKSIIKKNNVYLKASHGIGLSKLI